METLGTIRKVKIGRGCSRVYIQPTRGTWPEVVNIEGEPVGVRERGTYTISRKWRQRFPVGSMVTLDGGMVVPVPELITPEAVTSLAVADVASTDRNSFFYNSDSMFAAEQMGESRWPELFDAIRGLEHLDLVVEGSFRDYLVGRGKESPYMEVAYAYMNTGSEQLALSILKYIRGREKGTVTRENAFEMYEKYLGACYGTTK